MALLFVFWATHRSSSPTTQRTAISSFRRHASPSPAVPASRRKPPWTPDVVRPAQTWAAHSIARRIWLGSVLGRVPSCLSRRALAIEDTKGTDARLGAGSLPGKFGMGQARELNEASAREYLPCGYQNRRRCSPKKHH